MTPYQKYQLQWMIDHGYSLDDLISGMTEVWFDSGPDSTLTDIYEGWERERGFGGNIWACFDEWADCEGAMQNDVNP